MKEAIYNKKACNALLLLFLIINREDREDHEDHKGIFNLNRRPCNYRSQAYNLLNHKKLVVLVYLCLRERVLDFMYFR